MDRSNIDRSISFFNMKLFGCVLMELRVSKVGGVAGVGGPTLFGSHCTGVSNIFPPTLACGFDDEVSLLEALDFLKSQGVDTIDTARIYEKSEEILSKANATSRFLIDTKAPGANLKPRSLERVEEHMDTSLRELQTDKVRLKLYHFFICPLHHPE